MIATTENMIAEYATNLYALIRLSKSIPILRGSVIFVPLLWDENYLYCYLEGVGLSESIDTKCVNLSFSMKFVLVISLCKENRLFNEVFFLFHTKTSLRTKISKMQTNIMNATNCNLYMRTFAILYANCEYVLKIENAKWKKKRNYMIDLK